MTDAQITLLWIAGMYFGFFTVVGFAAMLIDKRRANTGRLRLRERTLIWIAGLGGALGVILGGRFVRHKTRKTSFHIKGLVLGGLLLAAVLFGWYTLYRLVG